MTWQPGQAAETPEDVAEWRAWQRARKLKQQRQRRASLRRIDYYPSEEAAAIIDAQRTNCEGGDASSIINRLVLRNKLRP